MAAYKIISKENGKFGVQREGSKEVHGNFDSWVEAVEAVGVANVANEMALADASQY